jgi:hypothetical protein
VVEARLETLNSMAIAEATTTTPSIELELSIISGLVLLGVLLLGAGCGPPS